MECVLEGVYIVLVFSIVIGRHESGIKDFEEQLEILNVERYSTHALDRLSAQFYSPSFDSQVVTLYSRPLALKRDVTLRESLKHKTKKPGPGGFLHFGPNIWSLTREPQPLSRISSASVLFRWSSLEGP